MSIAPTVYDFLSEENSSLWKSLLQPALRKIQKQVHPRLEIEDEAVAYLESLIYQLLAQMCAAQPHTIKDVELYVQNNFAAPINTWALHDAKLLIERAQKKRGGYVFPVDKMFPQLQKELFGYKIELNLVQFIMAILDYVSADILKLAGNFVKNTRSLSNFISSSDIKVSMSADPALQALFQPFHAGQSLVKDVILSHSFNEAEPSKERQSLSYHELLRELIDEESLYIRHLNLILKVFMEPFLNSKLFSTKDVETIFGTIQELHELSTQLLSSLDECMEMAGDVKGTQSPQAGFVFEELAETNEFEVYSRYAENYMEAIMILEELLTSSEVIKYLSSQEPKLFKEAVQYILPKSLLEPIYHCFYYFEVMDALMKTSHSDEDHEALESAITCMLVLKMDMERECARFLPKRKEDSGMFGKRPGYQVTLRKLAELQQKIEGWEGLDIFSCCTELITEGVLGVFKEGTRRSQKTERHVFLMDGLVICCKTKGRGTTGEYRLKEKINMRKVKLVDTSESEDPKFAFMLVEQDQPGIVFYTISKPEKNEWMASLTHLLTRSTFDRLLDQKLREEERMIPVLTPFPDKYKFAEEDSGDSIMFDVAEEKTPGGGPGHLIKGGTIHKLVERLTYHEYADPTFVRTFLMTYRSFSNPKELMELLVARFHIPIPVNMDDPEIRRDSNMMKAVKRFKANYITPIQLRVLNVLRHWVESHYYDFDRDPELLSRLKEFVGSVTAKNMQKWVVSIHRALKKKEDEQGSSASRPIMFDSPPEPVEWHLTRNKDEYHILTLHPVEFARQLTLIQSEYFRAILPSELVDASWMKEQKKEKASPNLLKLNRFETKISNWLAMEIAFMENFEERVALVSRLVDIMVALRQLNNFAGMFVINAAYESASVYRLKSTFRALQPKRQQVLEDMKLIASADRGYKNYKEKLRTINPPCVPFLGMYMSWIVFIRENEDRIPGKPQYFINFKKRRKIADVLQEIQQYQNTPYCLTTESSIQDYIHSQDPFGNMASNQWEDHLFEQSRLIEPKDQPVKKAPRKFKFDLKPPQDSRGYGLGTLIGRNRHKHANLAPTQQDGQHEDGAEHSPSSGSAPSSPSPFLTTGNFENGLNSPDKRKASTGSTPERDRAYTEPAPPKRPPKPAHMSSLTNIQVPLPSNEPAPPVVPPRPSVSGGSNRPPPLGPKSGSLSHIPLTSTPPKRCVKEPLPLPSPPNDVHLPSSPPLPPPTSAWSPSSILPSRPPRHNSVGYGNPPRPPPNSNAPPLPPRVPALPAREKKQPSLPPREGRRSPAPPLPPKGTHGN